MSNIQGTTYSMRQQSALLDALAPIAALLNDPSINEIMVNAPNVVFIRQRGVDIKYEVELNSQTITTAITLLAAFVAKEVNTQSQLLSARLPGFRIECVLPPVAVNGPTMCIRRHANNILTLDQYIESNVITSRQAVAIRKIIAERKNFLIAGGTYSGKTTLMNCILSMIDESHRLFVIEQISELKISAPNNVLLECDPEYGVNATDAVRSAMRYSPDRIILGELRGPEANDWLEAANTGHPGSGATLHANNARDALKRLGSLVLMASSGMPFEIIQDRIGSTVEAVLYIKQQNGVRVLSEVCLVNGYDRDTKEFDFTIINHEEEEVPV
jgi:pilus assembly protein CpaF